MQGRIGDPLRGSNRRGRSPELEQRKGTELVRKFRSQRRWPGVAVGQLATIRLVNRPRGDADLVAGGHIVPPEQIGGSEVWITPFGGLPKLLAIHEVIGLAPQPDFHEIPEQPTVSDDSMVAWFEPRQEGRLNRPR